MDSKDKEIAEALQKLVSTFVKKEFDRRDQQEKEEIIGSDAYLRLVGSVREYLNNGGEKTNIPSEGPAFEYMQNSIVKGIKRGWWKDHPDWIIERAKIGTIIRNGGKFLPN
ncbi:hypothetical protein [Chryseosolibacter indicus]|uniref:Uncharacterized protein n=1 Tax=Chryseosolibacter indicus TaxID=2782351 RepID=A0ABS5VWW0_9BACT|nr:hypothetical protein [Chryseosolibacter indicus]MBT1705548.1 hypothetical protein [Chryseosolibacter indicus]